MLAAVDKIFSTYSPECVEGVSLLKKWLSARSGLQESPKTSPKHYENDVFGSRTGGTREREGVFQHAGVFSEVRLWGVHESGIMLTMKTVAH